MPKDLLEGISLRGLSVADLVILLAHHGPERRRRLFFRDQLFLNWWYDVHGKVSARGHRPPGSHRSVKAGKYQAYELVAQRWAAIPEATRAWIAPGHSGLASCACVHGALVRARKERGPDWVLRPDTAAHSAAWAKKKAGCWFRNRLWLNWYETVEAPTWRNLKAIAEGWGTASTKARHLLCGDGPKYASCGAVAFEAVPSNKVVCRAVEHARRLRDGAKTTGQRPAEDLRRRRRKWLEMVESGLKRSEVPAWWNGLEPSERAAIGGKNYCDMLPVRRGRKARTTSYVHEEVNLARWEREIEGKPARYGQGLWFLRNDREGKSAEDIAKAWGRMAFPRRKHYCPQHPEPVQGSAKARRQYVHDAIRLARQHGAERFLESLLPKGFIPPAPSCRQRNDLFLEIRKTRWREAEERLRGIVRLCKKIPHRELKQRGIDPALVLQLPDSPRGAAIVNSGIREARKRRDGATPNGKAGPPSQASKHAPDHTKPNRKKKRGPYKTAFDPEKDRSLSEGWTRARKADPDMTKAQYAGRVGKTLREVQGALERHRKR